MRKIHNLSRFDLNLLLVFDAVFAERSVTKAARRLSVTQTAISHALSRIRDQFKDPLFVRAQGGMRPTSRALELAPFIRQALEQVGHVISRSEFDPNKVAHTFRIAITEYFAMVALPQVVRRIETEAPNVVLITVPNVLINAPLLLDSQEIDFAIGYFQDSLRDLLPPRLKAITLFKDHHVCVMRRDHPLARKKLTMQAYLAARHLMFSLHGEHFGMIDRLLRRMKVRRRIGLTVSHYMAAPPIIQDSDMIMTLTSRMAARYEDLYDLHVSTLPFKVPPAPMQLIWNDRIDVSAIHRWMRSLIVDISARL